MGDFALATMAGIDTAPAEEYIASGFQKQKAFFASGVTRDVGWRKGQIMALMTAITGAADRLSEAQAQDGVCPSDFRGAAGMLTGAAYFYVGNIDGWSAPKSLADTLPVERQNGIECDWSCVMEPKGVVLNIAPWNAPVILSVLPVLGALAAGNCCVIKPPEHCPATSKLLVELIGGAVAAEAVQVIEGCPVTCSRLIDLGFDHLMFTGGTGIGKLVMERAAKTLTPCTLELGGKNPVLIDTMSDGMLAAVVAEIVGTKAYFAGEFCQCHDTLLVVSDMWDRFTIALEAAVTALGDRRNVRMIHANHFARVKAMLDSHTGTSSPPVPEVDDASLMLPVTAILNPAPTDPVMLDEVFGPLWCVLRVESVDEGVTKANSSATGKPLVSYYYGESEENANKWLSSTSSGSVAINTGPMRMQSNFNAAIHGVGNSGLGGASIWGEHVFTTFSHAKHVVRTKDNAFAGSIWSGPVGTFKPAAAE